MELRHPPPFLGKRFRAIIYARLLNAVTRLRDEQHALFLVPQVLYEFWVIATRPAEQNGFGFTPAEAAHYLSRLQRLFTPLRDERSVFDRWERLVIQHQVAGKGA